MSNEWQEIRKSYTHRLLNEQEPMEKFFLNLVLKNIPTNPKKNISFNIRYRAEPHYIIVLGPEAIDDFIPHKRYEHLKLLGQTAHDSVNSLNREIDKINAMKFEVSKRAEEELLKISESVKAKRKQAEQEKTNTKRQCLRSRTKKTEPEEDYF